MRFPYISPPFQVTSQHEGRYSLPSWINLWCFLLTSKVALFFRWVSYLGFVLKKEFLPTVSAYCFLLKQHKKVCFQQSKNGSKNRVSLQNEDLWFLKKTNTKKWCHLHRKNTRKLERSTPILDLTSQILSGKQTFGTLRAIKGAAST